MDQNLDVLRFVPRDVKNKNGKAWKKSGGRVRGCVYTSARACFDNR